MANAGRGALPRRASGQPRSPGCCPSASGAAVARRRRWGHPPSVLPGGRRLPPPHARLGVVDQKESRQPIWSPDAAPGSRRPWSRTRLSRPRGRRAWRRCRTEWLPQRCTHLTPAADHGEVDGDPDRAGEMNRSRRVAADAKSHGDHDQGKDDESDDRVVPVHVPREAVHCSREIDETEPAQRPHGGPHRSDPACRATSSFHPLGGRASAHVVSADARAALHSVLQELGKPLQVERPAPLGGDRAALALPALAMAV
jgi:hypothetical protein